MRAICCLFILFRRYFGEFHFGELQNRNKLENLGTKGTVWCCVGVVVG